MKNFLQRYFKLKENNTSIRVELIAALTTFVTMVYIIFVNPEILSQTGMDTSSVFVATCLVAATGSFLVGILANYPIALAPGMGLNAYFVYIIARHAGFNWQSALGAMLITGILFILLVIFRLHRKIIAAIPHTLILGIIIGMGLLIALVGLQNMQLIMHHPHEWFHFGSPQLWPVLLFLFGLVVIVVLHHFKILGGILISILTVTALSLLFGISKFHGIISLPPSIKPTLFSFNLHQLFNLTGLGIICAFFIAGLFDFSGVTMGILKQTKIPKQYDYQPRFAKALLSDGIATLLCGCFGSSGTTAYLENSAGIHAGGRTGLTAVIIAILFLLVLFFAPLTKTIPVCATAAPLIFIGYHMAKHVLEINWSDLTDFIPTLVIAAIIPYAGSVADGAGAGFIMYIILKLIMRKTVDINPTLIIFGLIFVIYFLGT
ncbi:MAG: NCS2 family permease [Gammaproteobacteria bacterium]|jgi:AGZA family xanthine/uracil permease-like MFS transporter